MKGAIGCLDLAGRMTSFLISIIRSCAGTLFVRYVTGLLTMINDLLKGGRRLDLRKDGPYKRLTYRVLNSCTSRTLSKTRGGTIGRCKTIALIIETCVFGLRTFKRL